MKKGIYVILTTLTAVFLLNFDALAQCNWFIQYTGYSNNYNDVSYHGYYRTIVGAGGQIVYSPNEGYYWYTANSGTTQNLNAVQFFGDTGYVAGDAGTMLKSTDGGVNWVAQNSNITTNITAMYFLNADTGYVVTSSGSVGKTFDGGNTWTVQTLATYGFNAVYFISATKGFAAGLMGMLYKTNDGGTTWTYTTGLSGNLNTITFTDTLNGYIGTGNGTILKSADGGSTWTTITTQSAYNIIDIAFYSESYGYAVGDMGSVLKTVDYGVTWEMVQLNTGYNFNAIWVSQDGKMIVGDMGGCYKYSPEFIVSQPQDVDACTNQAAVFTAGVASQQNISSAQWQFYSDAAGWVNCPFSDGIHFGTTTYELTVYGLTDTTLSGNMYRCIISSYCSTDTTNEVTLTIHPTMPGFITGLSSYYCPADTLVEIHGNFNYPYFEGNGVVQSTYFNPSFVTGDSTVITYYYTDTNNCSGSVQKIVYLYPEPIVTVDSLNNNSCGATAGYVSVIVSDGLPPYNYHWSTGGNTPVVQNLNFGFYQVTVTDSRGCTGFVEAQIINQNGPDVFIENIIPTSCSNVCDGSAVVYASGNSPFTYEWSNGNTNDTATALCYDNYSVTVTDAAGCSNLAFAEIGFTQEAGRLNVMIQSNQGYISSEFITIRLFSADTATLYQEVDGFEIAPSTGEMINIANIPSGNYYLQVVPSHDEFPQLASSFYKMQGSTYSIDSATAIPVTCGGNQYVNVFMYVMFDNGTGNGAVSGYITTAQTTKNSKKGIYITNQKLLGEPIPGAEVYVELEPGDEPIANTTTNAEGFYSFNTLAPDSYLVNVIIPGVPMENTWHFVITDEDTNYTNLNFYLDTAGTIVVDSTNSVDVVSGSFNNVVVYPNPSNGAFTVNINLTDKAFVETKIFNSLGKEVEVLANRKMEKGNCNFNVQQDLTSGIYFVRVRVNNTVYIKKVVVQ